MIKKIAIGADHAGVEYKQSLIYNAVTGKIDCRTEAAR